MICFSSHTIRRTKSPPQSHLALRKYSSMKSYQLCYLKAMTVGLSVATMYGNVQNFVWLPWQPFKSRNLISWGLFVTTTRRNTELLVHNLLLLWSKVGDHNLNRWWVMSRTSWRLMRAHIHAHTHTDTGNDNTQRPKLASCNKKWWGNEKYWVLDSCKTHLSYLVS